MEVAELKPGDKVRLKSNLSGAYNINGRLYNHGDIVTIDVVGVDFVRIAGQIIMFNDIDFDWVDAGLDNCICDIRDLMVCGCKCGHLKRIENR